MLTKEFRSKSTSQKLYFYRFVLPSFMLREIMIIYIHCLSYFFYYIIVLSFLLVLICCTVLFWETLSFHSTEKMKRWRWLVCKNAERQPPESVTRNTLKVFYTTHLSCWLCCCPPPPHDCVTLSAADWNIHV